MINRIQIGLIKPKSVMGNENMKILIFGFKPFLEYKENITEQVIGKLKGGGNLKKIVFPVKFGKNLFLKAIEKYKPSVILGLGQAPRIKKVNIERRTVNLKKNTKKEKPKKIEQNGPKYRFVNWKLKKNKDSRISYNAGDYVCNFCIYIVSKLAEEKHIKFAFLHIPEDYNVRKAVKFIESNIT